MGCCGGGVRKAARRAVKQVEQAADTAQAAPAPVRPAKPFREPVLVKNKGAYYRLRRK